MLTEHSSPPALGDEAELLHQIGLPRLSDWRVGSLEGGWMVVRATDWLSALGAALFRMGLSDGLGRMACEVLPNGNVIANDLTQRRRFTVQQIVSDDQGPDPLGPIDISPEDLTPLDELFYDEAITELRLRLDQDAAS